MKINKISLYLNLFTATLIAAVFFIFSVLNNNSPQFKYQTGQIVQDAIKAPFAFTIYKPENVIQQEIYQNIKDLPQIYSISENIRFKIQKDLDYIFIELDNSFEANDTTNLYLKFQDQSVRFSDESVTYLSNNLKRQHLYSYLKVQINNVMSKPVYNNDYTQNLIRLADNNRIVIKNKSQLISLDQAKKSIIDNATGSVQKTIVSEIVEGILVSNLEINDEMNEAEKQKIRKTINPIIGKVDKDEIIINKNQKITDSDITKLQSLEKAFKEKNIKQDRKALYVSSLGIIFFNLIIFSLYFVIIGLFFGERHCQLKHRILILMMFFINSSITIGVYSSLNTIYLSVIPFSLFVIIISFIINPSYAFVFSTFNLILLGQFTNWNMFFIFCAFVSSIFAVYIIKRSNQVNNILIFFYMIIGYFISLAALNLYRFEGFASLAQNLGFGVISSILSILGAMLLTPLIEKKFNFASKQTLLELLDFNKPLMKQLAKEAPGTYYHSLVVGNLAEAAAESIRANSLIARVGSYYHDIGKLKTPEIFIENNPESSLIHDNLPPQDSASRIKNHVLNGIKLAKQHKLPDYIIDIIIQHHGDNKIKYFYHKAQTNNQDINDSDFSYEGPIPKTKEAALVMIADIVESTTKSLNEYSHASISKVLDSTIIGLIQDHQLDDAPLTLKDMTNIKKTMLPILESVYRKRIEYPEEIK